MASSFRRFVGRVAVAALAVAVPVVMTPLAASADAAPTELFFSEYIEGSSNNKALEIYNGTGAAVDLAAGGYSVQMFSNGVATAGPTITLTGTVATGDVFVLAHDRRDAAILAQADQTNGAGLIQRRRRGRPAQGHARRSRRLRPDRRRPRHRVGHGPDEHRRQHPAPQGRRSAPATPTARDAFDPAVEWDGFAVDTFDGLGAHAATCDRPPDDAAPPSPRVTPAAGAHRRRSTSSPTVTFSEAVTAAGGGFTLACTGAGPCPSPSPAARPTFTLDPTADLAVGDAAP